MANSKITDLASLTAASGDELPVNRAGSDGKITLPLVVAAGGTGATSASGARTNLELVIGISNDQVLTAKNTPNSAEYARFTAAGLEGRTEAEFKADFNLEANTDFYAPGGTDVAIADGGTGASTASAAFTALKQAASDTATGVVELATALETALKTSTSLVPTPADLINFDRRVLIGCEMTTNGTDAIDISVGVAASDVSPYVLMEQATSGLTKNLANTWAVGDAQNGLDTGSVATSTWYHVYIIMRVDTGVVDALFSTNSVSPTLPANYTHYRRIGSVYRDSAGDIQAFYQKGDVFQWAVSVTDISASTADQLYMLVTISTPLGIMVQPLLSLVLTSSTATTSEFYVGDPRDGGTGNMSINGLRTAYTSDQCWGNVMGGIFTNTASQIYVERDEQGGDSTFTLYTSGWIDARGRT